MSDDINLSGLSGAFAASKVDLDGRSSNEEPPDGEYEATIEKSYLRLSSTGKPMVSWQFRIDGPQGSPQIGRCLFRHDVLASTDAATLADKVGRLRTDFHRLGVGIETEQDLKTKPAEAVGKRAAVKKRTKGGFVDVFINGVLGPEIDPSCGF